MNPFDLMYEGTPPWETGRPQPAIAGLIERGLVHGRVLDVGCGTGENALAAAAQGCQVVAVDAAARAITLARQKAVQRGLTVDFRVHDALALGALGGRFDTVIDCGLFHTFSDGERRVYTRSLAAVLGPGSVVHLLCFSDREPNWGGPRRVSEGELRSVFRAPFAVESLVPTRFESLRSAEGAEAWLCTIVHVGRVVSVAN